MCGKKRGMCTVHGGWQLCKCKSGHHHSRCTKCGSGNKLCEHKKRYNNCMTCLRENQTDGVGSQYLSIKSEICPCKIARKHCNNTACGGGSHLCVTCKLTQTRMKHTECSVCRRFRDGQAPLKLKERALKSFLDTQIDNGVIPKYTSYDKVVEPGLDKSLYGCNRPDFSFRLADRWVLVEVDEYQHKGGNYKCERRRELQLLNCSGNLPVVFIRFNPDTFATGSKSSRVKVPAESINRRHEMVLEELKEAIGAVNPTGLKFVKLFFDCDCIKPDCGFSHSTSYVDHEDFLKAFQ